jgi:hypothetical protein
MRYHAIALPSRPLTRVAMAWTTLTWILAPMACTVRLCARDENGICATCGRVRR